MAKRPHRSSRHVEQLRLTIDCLPVSTREAMLQGVRSSERIIVGAYTDGDGGMCPMLAAHRCGGRTSLLSFARAWDRFTRAGRRARRATRREVAILLGQLEGSLMGEIDVELDRAISEHRELMRRRPCVEVADPSGTIVARRITKASRPRFSGGHLAHPTGRRLRSPVSSRR
jgi:hypothetical protein